MAIKWIGAVCVIFACGGFGFQIAAAQIKENRCLQQLIYILDFAQCELEFRVTPLPELCKRVAEESTGVLKKLFERLVLELEEQISPNAQSCMEAAIAATENVPKQTQEMLKLFGATLGKFDLNGQVRGIESVRKECTRRLEQLAENQDTRVRSYKTLGICAGAALVILFI